MSRYDLPDPKCEHVVTKGKGTMVASHKDIGSAKGRMASVRVCHRADCVQDAMSWVQAHGFSRVWVNGEKPIGDWA